MKMKRIALMMSLAGAVLLASCAKQMMEPAPGGRSATVTVGVGLSEMSTRAYADGTTAKQLQYAVYEVNGNDLTKVSLADTDTKIVGDSYEGTKKMDNLRTQLSFSLLTGHTYGIVFWADAYGKKTAETEETPYTVDFADSGVTMTVNQDYEFKANDENLDAFYAYKEITVNGDGSVSVQLSRPFAQINIGTNDFEKAKHLGGAPDQSYVTVPTYKTLDLTNGKASDPITATFEYNTIPGQTEGVGAEEYPVEGYEYLAMAYVLVGEETIDVTFGWAATPATSGKERKVGSVPVKPNYRTNIYGSILTGSLDLNVEIVPGVGGEDNVMLTWDGVTLTQPAYDADKHIWTVKGADELAWLASQADKDFAGQTIKLQSDLDLAGEEFPTFAAGATRNGNSADGSFKGVFDGNGKTISNFKTAKDFADDGSIAGFFASIAGEKAAVKNVTFTDVEIEGGEQAGVVGIVSEGATVEGVVVKSGKVSGQKAAGGIVGRVLKSGIVRDCENHAAVESKTANAGGIVGAAYYTEDGKTMIVTGCDNYGTISGTSNSIGGIVGLNCGDVSDCNNFGKSVIGSAASVGGIVGEQKAAGSVKGCTNYADVTGGANNSHNGVGGIVGWVRYASSNERGSYPFESSIEVSGNTNKAKYISGYTGVGGIVGAWYHDGICSGNTNFAETITAQHQFVASIVGDSQWGELGSDAKSVNETNLKLCVIDNVSYTNYANNITGGCKAEYVYINNSQRTEQSNNTNPSMTTVGSAEDFKSAFEDIKDGDIIVLSAGEFDCKTVTWPKNGVAVTIKGNGADKSSITNIGYVNTTGCSLTFEDITIKVEKQGTGTSIGFDGATSVSLKNVTVLGEFHTKSAAVNVENCHFYFDEINNAERYALWIYGCKSTVVKDCVFEVIPPEGKETKAILINYNDLSDTKYTMGDVTIENCKFEAGLVSTKAAIEIHSENFASAGTLTIKNCTYDNATYQGGLWREIYNKADETHGKGEKTLFYTVYVDGQLAQEAKDGKN